MRTETGTLYVCECCEQRFVYEGNCLVHEPKCFERKRRKEELDHRADQAHQDALALARADGALRLLVGSGYGDTARERADALLDGLAWTPNCSAWWTGTVNNMVEAAREAAEEERNA
jgi:hypothetical protein